MLCRDCHCFHDAAIDSARVSSLYTHQSRWFAALSQSTVPNTNYFPEYNDKLYYFQDIISPNLRTAAPKPHQKKKHTRRSNEITHVLEDGVELLSPGDVAAGGCRPSCKYPRSGQHFVDEFSPVVFPVDYDDELSSALNSEQKRRRQRLHVQWCNRAVGSASRRARTEDAESADQWRTGSSRSRGRNEWKWGETAALRIVGNVRWDCCGQWRVAGNSWMRKGRGGLIGEGSGKV